MKQKLSTINQRLSIFAIFLFVCVQGSVAQTPKWVDKAKRAVFSVVTYDSNDKILSTGNGFFLTEDGVAVSDYSLFKGAERAVVMDIDGKQMPVSAIMGADGMYDVIKFRVDLTGKKVAALSVAAVPPALGAEVYLLPYSTQKDRSCTKGSVSAVDRVAAGNDYYTLNLPLRSKMVSCPLMTADGQVFGLAQQASGQDTASISYAVDVRFARSLEISALSYNDLALQSIGIKKALPDTEEQALVFLYMVSNVATPEKYMSLLDDFIAQYPRSADGYIRRATARLSVAGDESALRQVSADMDKALEVAAEKDDVHYDRARLIYNYVLQQPETAYEGWSFDKALEEVKQAVALNPLPVYVQLEGDIQYARQDYAAALACYEQVNGSSLASAATFFSAAQAKTQLQAPQEEILALMDSCVSRFDKPYTEYAAPYLLARAQVRMEAGKAREALVDYDDYYNAVGGRVNDLFYSYRAEAAQQAKQFQRALDDWAKAIELGPQDLMYKAGLAALNIRLNRHEEAISVLQEALAIDPEFAEGYRLMGLAQIRMKKNAEACASFAKAKELGHPEVDELIDKYCK